MAKTVLQIKNLSKSFNGNIVLDNINIDIYQGKVHSILGENGAGKSTLVNILAGIYTQDSGNIFIKGEKVSINNSEQSKNLGINIIFQEHNLFDDFTIAENLFSDQFIRGKKSFHQMFDFISLKKITEESQNILDKLDFNLNSDTLVMNLNLAQKRMVEIARAVLMESDIIIMDEPTSAISEKETGTLFEQIKSLKNKGITIIYVSQRLEDILKISDTVTILRDGQIKSTFPLENFDIDNVVKMMSGEDFSNRYPKLNTASEKVVFEAKYIYTQNLNGVSFELKKGEVLGFSGLIGSGRSELAKTIFGAILKQSGSFFKNKKQIHIKSPLDAIKNGIVYIPDDRRQYGLFYDKSVGENIIAPHIPLSKQLLLKGDEDEEMLAEYLEKVEVKIHNIKDKVSTLSGGNQQKIMLLKWFTTDADVFIFDEPTAGIDIASKVDVYNLMADVLRKGASIILLSSDINELMGICDRIMILHDGNIIKEFSVENAKIEDVYEYTIGSKKE